MPDINNLKGETRLTVSEVSAFHRSRAWWIKAAPTVVAGSREKGKQEGFKASYRL